MDEVEEQLRTYKLVTNFLFQCVSLCIGLSALSCSTENPSYCDSDKACTGGLFCDIDGTFGEAPCNPTYSLFSEGDELVAGMGNLQADPLFANISSGDYHLQLGSPAINAGNPFASIETDIDGQPREVSNSSPDIGADEYKEAQ